MSEQAARFSSTREIIVLTRPVDSGEDWQELDRGPGYFSVPPGYEVRIRIKGIDDNELHALVKELQGVEALRFLDLAENRNVTNSGLMRLKALPQLTGLNISSCTVTDSGIEQLRDLHHLQHLNVSYCNRLTDVSLKTFEAMRSLTYVDMQGCLSVTTAGLARIRRRNLTIYRK